MKITVSKLRENIYQILDSILKTGRPVEIERHGKRLRISMVDSVSKLRNLEKKDIIVGEAEDLVRMDWSKEWKPRLK